MATAPLSGHRPPIDVGGIRRSFTQPPRSLSFHEKAGLDPSDSAADILYSHSQARIVSFKPPFDALRSTSSPVSVDLDYPVDTIETLPWAASGEDVLASGSLIIEKVRGSTNFLKSGTKPLHALMRNSQCWCVDDEATLVLRVGTLKYYRIELPYNTEEERAKVEQLKEVLRRILRFETTHCPFKRGFHVDLPESATTPRKKGPWKRKPGSVLSSPVSSTPSPLSLPKSRARAPSVDHKVRCEEQVSPPVPLDEGDESPVGDAVVTEDAYAIRHDVQGDDDTIAGMDLGQEDQQPLGALEETSVLSGLQANEDPTLKSCDGRVKVEIPCDHEAAEEYEVLDSENTPSCSLATSSSQGRNSQSGDGLYDGFDRASGLSSDSYTSIGKTAIMLAHSQAPKDNFQNGAEGLVAQQSPNSKDRVGCPDEHAYEENLSEDDRSITAHGPGSNSRAPPAELDQPAQLRPESPACSPERRLLYLAPEQRRTELCMDGFEGPTTSSLSDTASISSCSDSFHSLASLGSRSSDINVTSAECSAPAPLADAHHPSHHHTRDASDMTVTVTDAPGLEMESPMSPVRPSTATSEGPSTPSLLRSSASDSSWPEVETPAAVSTSLGHRQRPEIKRSLSPLTSSSTDLTSPPQSPRGSHLTVAILRGARNLALGRPIEAIVMLVHILFRIAGGATPDDLMNGELFRRPFDGDAAHHGHRSPPDQLESRQGEASEDDDYGVPIRGRSRSAAPAIREDDDADSLFDLD